ncbi:MAG: glycoside hydrolase family 127 protein [Anaerolineae bacterium]
MPDRGPNPVVVDTSTSPHARLRPVPLSAVSLADAFWSPRLRALCDVTLPSQHRLLEETGRIDNLRYAAGKKAGDFQGWFFNDSDVYKWLEAVAWTLAWPDDAAPGSRAALAPLAEAVIAEVAAAQEADGYLDSYFSGRRAAERWTNLRDLHELYCAGHLIQAAVAHRRTTGSGHLLAVARRLADLVCNTFGPQAEGKRPAVPGHEVIEMALVELARETGEAAYLRQARYFLDARGRGLIGGRAYHQDHAPFREMERLEGHAVRAVYLAAGAADVCAETGEPALDAALERLWTRLAARQTYVSGGLGARHEGEALGNDYELPNARAYAETCAAIGAVMWYARMLALEGQARYADALETALYNGVLVGLSLDGAAYFYSNPLWLGHEAVDSDGEHRRQPWFDCACCPPNVARLLASLPGSLYSLSREGVWVHLYAAGTVRLRPDQGRGWGDGQALTLRQHTRYPWDGEVVLEVEGRGPFDLYLRLPAWCGSGAALSVNGRPSPGDLVPGTYARLSRDWQPGDTVRLELPMPVRRVEAHPYVSENVGRLALMRGPLLYCLEGADHPGLDLRDLVLPGDESLTAGYDAGLLGGVVALRGQARLAPPDAAWEAGDGPGRLYRTAKPSTPDGGGETVPLTAIPYYAWANREAGALQVWIRSDR